MSQVPVLPAAAGRQPAGTGMQTAPAGGGGIQILGPVASGSGAQGTGPTGTGAAGGTPGAGGTPATANTTAGTGAAAGTVGAVRTAVSASSGPGVGAGATAAAGATASTTAGAGLATAASTSGATRRPVAGSSAAATVAPVGQDLQKQLDDLKQQVQAIQSGVASTESLIKDLIAHCGGHHSAVFSPDRALALVDNIVSVARREGSDKVESFEAYADEIYQHKAQPYLRHLILRYFGSKARAQAVTTSASFVKSWKVLNEGFEANVVQNPNPPVMLRQNNNRQVRGHWGRLGRDQCAACYGRGHWARDCPQQKQGKQFKPRNTRR